jgi:hypothetical protein
LNVKNIADQIALPDNPDQIQDQFQLKQWREIEEILTERGAADTGTTLLSNGLRFRISRETLAQLGPSSD